MLSSKYYNVKKYKQYINNQQGPSPKYENTVHRQDNCYLFSFKEIRKLTHRCIQATEKKKREEKRGEGVKGREQNKSSSLPVYLK